MSSHYFANIKQGCNVNIFDLVSVNMSCQTLNNLHSVSQNFVNNQHKYKPERFKTNKTEYNRRVKFSRENMDFVLLVRSTQPS